MNTEAIFMGLGLSAQNSPFCCVPSPRFSNLMRRSLLTTNVGFHQYAFHGSLTGHVSDIFKSQLVVKEGCVESPILSDHNSSFNSSSGRQPHLLPTTASKRKQNIKQHPTFVNDVILSSRPHVYRNSMANMSDQVDRLSRNTWLEETKRLKEIRTFHPRLCNAMDIQSTAHNLHDESKIVEKLNPQGGSYSWSQSLDSVHIKGEFSNSHVQGHLATITENSQTLSKRILNKKLYRQTHIEHKNRVFLSSKDANKKFLGNYDLNKYKQTPEVMMSSQNMGRINNQSVATDVNKQYNSTGNHSTINILKEAATKVLSDYEQKLFKLERVEISNDVNLNDKESGALDLLETYVEPINFTEKCDIHSSDDVSKLTRIYDKVLVIDNVLSARRVVKMLTTKYKHLIHACDTEVAKIDVKTETPVDHGEIICFSIFSGSDVDFGDGKSCIWVDVLDGSRDVLMEFAPFFEDPSIRKVWHNYSFDCHIIENYGIKVSGFHADTMHLARLWDSSRRMNGGYSLEALTGDRKVMNGAKNGEFLVGKISMKSIFGKKKIKKDGSEGKVITMAPVEELQREERVPWICYSALDSISTLRLFESLKKKLLSMKWTLDGVTRGTMYDFYEEYWKPFGEILVKMETEGMLVDRSYLSEVEKVAVKEQQIAADWFRKWASKYCPDAMYMNVGSDAQLRQLFFGGVQNRKNPNESLPHLRVFKVPNTEGVIEEGKKAPSKYRNISLHNLGVEMQTETYTSSGWPSVSGDALKALAGKVSAEEYHLINETDLDSDNNDEMGNESISNEADVSLNRNEDSSYGTAFAAFRGDEEGREACYAIASLCEVCSIDSLISNFILPLQGSHISGKYGRVHCSLNINTETGRLSARRPNLQNQPALEKDRYKIRQAFIAEPGNSLVVADYGQLELRILAHLSNCKSMLDAFKAGGDFHSRTAMNMYPYIKDAVEEKRVLLEWYPQPGEEKPPVPLLKDAFASERRKAKMLNFSIAYGKTPVGLSRDWKVSLKEAKETVDLWYKERKEVLLWQDERKKEAREKQCVYTLLGRARRFPSLTFASNSQRGHIERAAINTPVQGSAADVAMCAMIEISRNTKLKELGWRLLLQVHDEVILEGPTESAEVAKAIVVECMSKPFYGTNFLKVDLVVDSKCAQNWYAAK